MSPLAGRSPVLAAMADDGGRFYEWDGERYWSVTTILGRGVPKHLQAHYAKLAAELAYAGVVAHPYGRPRAIVRRWAQAGRAWVEERQARGELKSIKLAKLTEEELALRWLKGAAERHRDAAAARGSAVHAEAEDLVLANAREAGRLILAGVPLPEYDLEIAGHMASFVRFVDDWEPEFLAAEATVFHRTQAYAGTIDAFVTIDRTRLLPFAETFARLGIALPDTERVTAAVDYKSGRDVYPEVAMQLSAYARGEFIGAPDGVTQLSVPQADIGIVLHLTPDGYRPRPVRIDDSVYLAFLYAREVFRWAAETSREVLGDPLELAAKEVA